MLLCIFLPQNPQSENKLQVPNGSTANVRVAFAWGQENSLDVHVDSAEQGEASGHAHEATHQQPAPAPQVSDLLILPPFLNC